MALFWYVCIWRLAISTRVLCKEWVWIHMWLQWRTAHGTWCWCCAAQDCVESWCDGCSVYSGLSKTSTITWSLLLWRMELGWQPVLLKIPVNISWQMFFPCVSICSWNQCRRHGWHVALGKLVMFAMLHLCSTCHFCNSYYACLTFADENIELDYQIGSVNFGLSMLHSKLLNFSPLPKCFEWMNEWIFISSTQK